MTRMKILVIQVVTVLSLVNNLPTNNGENPVFVKPLTLPPLSTHSTLSPELLNILRRYQFNSILPSPSTSSSSQIFPTSYEPSFILEPIESNNNILDSSRLSIPETPYSNSNLLISTIPNQLSDLDRVLNSYRTHSQNTQSLDSFQKPVQNLLPKSTSMFATFPPSPITETPSLTRPIPSPTSHYIPSSTPRPTPSPSPFPDSNPQLPIQPMKLSPESNEDILHLLFDYPTSTSQESIQNPYPLPICSSSLTPVSKTPPLLTSRSTLPLTDPHPLSTQYDSLQHLLHFLLNSTSMQIKQSNTAFSDNDADLNLNSPQTITRQSSTIKSHLNPAFIKYLKTLPSSITR